MRTPILLLLASVLSCAGCGSSCIGRGVALYEERNYIEAAEAFERTQNRLATMQPVERVRYGLYRGLTLIELGDLRGGERWLDYADAQQRVQPNLLEADERVLLARGRVELAQRLQAIWPKPESHWTQGVAATTNGAVDDSTHQ